LKARDQEMPLLIGMAAWESTEAKDAAKDALSRAIEGDTFDEWETESFESFLLDEI
jgi:hypothetical protein